MTIAKVGQLAPEFFLTAVSATQSQPRDVRHNDYAKRWLVLIFYPHDFSFVCPTELTAFSARTAEFHKRDCDLLAVSVDSVDLHREWLTTSESDGGPGALQFPLGSDEDGVVARAYGVWNAEKQVAMRGLFIVDPAGMLQYAVVHNLDVGRGPDEVLRVLDALQSGGLCPATWTAADGTIDPESALQPGRILGHYRIRQKLGEGTFGTVFAAWDLHLERNVALKVLRKNVYESRDAIFAEARAAAKVNHPHVCTVYAVELEDGLPVIAMEYLSGRPLTQLIADGLDRAETLRLARQMADGLATAHQHGVVHGDLKPANVFVGDDQQVKLLDFGLGSVSQM